MAGSILLSFNEMKGQLAGSTAIVQCRGPNAFGALGAVTSCLF